MKQKDPTRAALQQLADLLGPAGGSSARSHATNGEVSEVAEPRAVYETGSEMVCPLSVSDESVSDELTVSVWHRLKKLEAAYAARGRSLTDLGSLNTLCERMVAAIPSPSLWDDLLGPFYGPGQVTRLLGDISRQAVADRRRRGTLLGLKTADGVWVYPTFQFGSDLEILHGLPAVLKVLADSKVDHWTLAGWLASPLEALGGLSPIQWLERREDLETLLVLAKDAALRFQQ